MPGLSLWRCQQSMIITFINPLGVTECSFSFFLTLLAEITSICGNISLSTVWLSWGNLCSLVLKSLHLNFVQVYVVLLSWSFFSNHICKYDHLIKTYVNWLCCFYFIFMHLSSLFPGFYFFRLNMLLTLYILEVFICSKYFLFSKTSIENYTFLTEHHLSCIIQIVLYSFMCTA